MYTVLYTAQVLLLLVVAPVVATAADTAMAGRSLLEAASFWFVFFGGVRLLIAGLSQVVRPGFTVEEVLGQRRGNPGANYVVQELGFANIGLGLLGIIGPWLGWAPAGALALGAFLLLAGVRHVAKTGKAAKEWVATVTDLAFSVVLLVILALSLVR